MSTTKMGTIYVLALAFALCGAVCYVIARKRGAKTAHWVAMGALFGPLAIPFVFFAKPRSASIRP